GARVFPKEVGVIANRKKGPVDKFHSGRYCNLLQRKADDEGTAMPQNGFDADMPAMLVHHALDERQPQSHPLDLARKTAFNLIKLLEDLGPFLGRNSRAVVGDEDLDSSLFQSAADHDFQRRMAVKLHG